MYMWKGYLLSKLILTMLKYFWVAVLVCSFVTAQESCDEDLKNDILNGIADLHDKVDSLSCKGNANVAFFARMSKKTITVPSVLKWDDVVTNVGNGYNKKTGIFTAPVSGLYNFQWSILAYHKTNAYTELVVGGKRIIRNHAEAHGYNIAKAATASAIINLKKGQKVWIRRYGGKLTFWGHLWSSFQGFKL